MKERLLEFLRNENKTSAQLAEEIGVQASGISHILSGRNNPSLDFILKMLEKYKFLSTDWLLFGKGTMYRDSQMQTLFDFSVTDNAEGKKIPAPEEFKKPQVDFHDVNNDNSGKFSGDPAIRSTQKIIRIVWFYENNSFEEFVPGF